VDERAFAALPMAVGTFLLEIFLSGQAEIDWRRYWLSEMLSLKALDLRQWIAAMLVLDIDEETTHSYAAIGLELKKTGRPIPSTIYGSPRSAANILCLS